MIGAYSEVASYSSRVQSQSRKQWRSTEFLDSLNLNLRPDLDPGGSEELPTFVRPELEKDDFILITEFSEIEGPVPLLIIPQDARLDLDLNDLAVKVMSTDYQGSGSSHSCIIEDVQVLHSNLSPGLHAYTHYITLCDVKARGFVRPICLSYLSHEKDKIRLIFEELRERFLKASSVLKQGNRLWFGGDLEEMLKDLTHTKETYLHWQTGQLVVSDEEKVSILSGISLSSLASQVAECQHMLHLLQPYLSEPTPLIDHWQSLAQTSPHTEPVFSLVHYLPKSRHERVRLRPSSPRVISPTPSKRPLQSEMNLYTLCQWGVLPALWILHRAHLRFKPSRVALQMRQFSTPPNSSLSFGPFSVLSLPDEDGASSDQNPLSEDSQNSILAWLRNNDVLGANNDSSRNSALWNSGPPDPPVEPSEDFPGMPLPTDFVDLVSYLNKRVKITEKRPPPSSRGPTLWSTRELNLEEEEVADELAHADDDLLRSVEVATKAQTISHLETDPHSISHLSSPNCPRVASVPFRGCPVSLAEHLDHITPGMSGHRICTFFRRNPSVFTHLVYSLLIGRPVVIAGHEDAQFTVRERVNALEIFLPWSPKKRDGYSDGNYSSQILRWHHGTVVSHHLSEYKIIGLCVPERLNVQDMMSSATLNQVTVLSVKTDHLSGPAYSGRLLAPLLLPIRPMFLTDAALLSQLLAIAFSIAGKLYLLHAVTSEGRLKIQRVLTSLGTEGSCDRLMLKYLLGLIRNETLVSLEAA